MGQEPRRAKGDIKAVFSGVRYDTGSAVWLGRLTARFDALHWFDESLYRTPTSGRYFLAGRGGRFSHYARPPYEYLEFVYRRILPLSYGEAKAWAELALPPRAFKREFPPPS